MIEKLFKAYDVRATTPDPLDAEAAKTIGYATGEFLKKEMVGSADKAKRPNAVVVGRDMRPTSPELAGALIDGLRAAGLDVVDIGMVDTSFIYYAINHVDAAGGVMVTASHNPIEYNGFKVSRAKAKPVGAGSGLNDIRDHAAELEGKPLPGGTGGGGKSGGYETADLWADYKKHVLSFLDLKRPIKVAIDASNGMAGKMVPSVFGDVEGLEIVPVLFEITGSFTHEPNPLVESNLAQLKETMKGITVDLGACFDGDADRCIFLDEQGRMISCDLTTALLAEDFLAVPKNAGSTIVYDLRSSHVVPDVVTAAGGVPRRDRVGHAFMKKTLHDTQGVFGGELSGHFYFRDNFYADSGAIAFACVLSVLSAQDRPLSALVEPLHKYSHSGEINFKVEDKDGTIKKLAESYKRGEVDYLDGITVDLGDWWFNVRASNTEPLLRLNLEAATRPEMDAKLAEVQKFLGTPVEGH